MLNHPFSMPIQQQLASIREGVAILEQFAEKYPSLSPFVVSPLTPSVYCDASQILACRDLFGPDGWEQRTHSIMKVHEGVTIECSLPNQYHPFSFGESV